MGSRTKIHAAGLGPTAVAQDIYEESTKQYYPLGERLQLKDGRVFHYALNGGNLLAAGNMTSSKVAIDDHTDLVLVTTVEKNSSYKVKVTLGGTLVTANQYAEGWLWVEGAAAGTYIGQCHQIKSHPAQATTTGDVIITLHSQIAEKIEAGTAKISMLQNQYKDLIIQATDPVALTVGVPLIPITATSDPLYYYFWLQTWGPCPVLEEDTPVAGDPACIDDGNDGAVSQYDVGSYAEQTVGTFMDIAGSNTMTMVFLRLDP